MTRFSRQRVLPPYPAGVVGGIGVLALVVAVLMQTYLDLVPCPLCILQRYCLIGTVAFCFAAAFTGRQGGRWLLMLAGAFALSGAGFAVRQVYLQSLPPMSQGCGPGFEYIVNSFPVSEMLPMLFKGTGDCSQVDWSWYGVTVPKLSLATFVGLSGLILWTWRRPSSASAAQ